MADLKVAVERISHMASEHDAAGARRAIDDHLATIDELHRRRAELYRRLLDARAVEVTEHEVGDYRGTLAAIAQRVQAEQERYGWIADLTAVTEVVPPPLGADDIVNWHRSLVDDRLNADEPESRMRLLPLADVPALDEFVALVTAERQAIAAEESLSELTRHTAFDAVRRLDPPTRETLRLRLNGFAREAGELARRREEWMDGALSDVLAGRAGIWQSRGDQIAQLIGRAEPLVNRLDPLTEVVAGDDLGALVALATALRGHLGEGGRLKTNPDGTPRTGAFAPKAVKQALPLFQAVRVNGVPPTATEQIDVFLTWAEGSRVLGALDKAWPDWVRIPAEDTLSERLQWHATELAQLRRVLALGTALEAEERSLAAIGLPRPNWTDLAAVQTYARLVDAAGAADARAAATAPLLDIVRTIADVAQWADAAPCVHDLARAADNRDHEAYATAHRRLARLTDVRRLTGRREETGAELGRSLSGLHEAVAADPHDPVWTVRLADWDMAWAWAVARAWVLRRSAEDVNALQAEVLAVERRVRDRVEQLAANRAWGHAVSPERLSGKARADLHQYAQLMKALGKGTGKYAEQRRADIKAAMERCRPAVPVWIMPMYRIAEQSARPAGHVRRRDRRRGLAGRPGGDVPAVPRAEDRRHRRRQAGLPVRGRHRPAAAAGPRPAVPVGRPVPGVVAGPQAQPVRRGEDAVRGHDHAGRAPALRAGDHRLLQPRRLRARRRAAGAGAPVRGGPPGADQAGVPGRRLRARRHRQDQPGRGGRDRRPDREVRRRSPLRRADLRRRVAARTAQAKRIEKLLLERVPPEEWKARELRCGDSADFQGSERDVMFLSMVKAPAPDQRISALTQDMYVQRFNVAASRAKDQMWVFHSLRPSELGNPEDMRFQLLDYCYELAGRVTGAEDSVRAVPEDRPVEPFDSLFEQRVFNRLVDQGYRVVPQFSAEGYRIDLVVVGRKARLAVECDGDAWHGPEAYERDLARQRDLERCGWRFFRIRESEFYVDRAGVLAQLWDALQELDIHPSGWTSGEDDPSAVVDVETPAAEVETLIVGVETPFSAMETRVVEPEIPVLEPVLPVAENEWPYTEPEFSGTLDVPGELLMAYGQFDGDVVQVATASRREMIDGLVHLVEAEGPVLGNRLHTAYVRASGAVRVTKLVAGELNKAISQAVREGRLVEDNPLAESGIKPRTYRLPDQPPVRTRQLGPRSFEEVPPGELAALLDHVAERGGHVGEEASRRAVLELLGLKRLTDNVRSRFAAIEAVRR